MRFYLRICFLLLATFIALRLLLSSALHRVLESKENQRTHKLYSHGSTMRLHVNITRDFSQLSEEMYYKKRPFVVELFQYDVMIMPRKPCTTNAYVVILVHSVHSKTEVRQAIRTTWGSVSTESDPFWPSVGYLNHTLKLFFVFGIHKDEGLNDLVIEENEKYGDIILGNFYDSYANMTLKSLLGLKFLIEYCPFPKFMMKSDDDMFLNIPAILNVLQNIYEPRFIMGPLCVHSKVYRNGKWKLTKEEFPFEFFPPYYAGSTYIISRDLWKELFDLSFYVPRIHIDDVYITGILGKILNVTQIKIDGFAYWNTKPATVCDIKTFKVLTTTGMKAIGMQNIWNSLNSENECSTNKPH